MMITQPLDTYEQAFCARVANNQSFSVEQRIESLIHRAVTEEDCGNQPCADAFIEVAIEVEQTGGWQS